jgi:predicted TIM-barrel fold metal-dependent hydrolase
MATPVIIDADAHVTEAPDVWTSRMSKKWGDLVPHVRRDDTTGRDCWFAGDRNFGPIANTTGVRVNDDGSPKHIVSRLDDAKGLADVHPSSYLAADRLKVMDDRGIFAQVLYPNMNFVGAEFHEIVKDPAFGVENIRAYNDYLVEEWAAVAPDRLLPIALLPFFDVHESAKEIYRAKELGHRGIAMTGKPQLHGQPYLADRHWDPVWNAAQETGLSVNFHIGAGPEGVASKMPAARLAAEGGLLGAGPRISTDLFIDNAMSFCDILNSGILARFPELQVVSVEGGIGWVNFILESLDYHFRRFEILKERPEITELPSFYFRRQCHVTYWFEQLDPYHVEALGKDNIMFETDFPHSTSLAADDVVWAQEVGLGRVAQDVKENILWRNAAKLYDVAVPEPV